MIYERHRRTDGRTDGETSDTVIARPHFALYTCDNDKIHFNSITKAQKYKHVFVSFIEYTVSQKRETL